MAKLIPNTTIHVTGQLINKPLRKIIKDKIKIFKEKRLFDASIEEIVGNLTGYEIVVNNKNCGGYCNISEKVIAISTYKDKDELRGKNFNLWLPARICEKQTIMHEIGHAIQADAELFANTPNLISKELEIEWQAESISYQLYNECFGRLNYRYFNSYFTRMDAVWLKEWYGDLVDDDLQLNSKN